MSAPIEIKAFVDQWISDCNHRDVEAVLAHFSDRVVFTSPRAKAIVGSTSVEGKSSLREYWTKALQRIQSMQFTLDHVVSAGDRIAIVYVSEINGITMCSLEFLRFGDDGLLREAEAMHGVEL